MLLKLSNDIITEVNSVYRDRTTVVFATRDEAYTTVIPAYSEDQATKLLADVLRRLKIIPVINIEDVYSFVGGGNFNLEHMSQLLESCLPKQDFRIEVKGSQLLHNLKLVYYCGHFTGEELYLTFGNQPLDTLRFYYMMLTQDSGYTVTHVPGFGEEEERAYLLDTLWRHIGSKFE